MVQVEEFLEVIKGVEDVMVGSFVVEVKLAADVWLLRVNDVTVDVVKLLDTVELALTSIEEVVDA